MTRFTPEALALLIENRLRDSKAFYDEHKPQFDALVRQPFYELIEAVAPTLQKYDPDMMNQPKRQISRIRRDTRFTKDKTLYRSGMWCGWRRDKRQFPNPPEFYFEFCADYVWWGCGLYFADPAFVDTYRTMILARDPIFLAAKECIDNQKRFVMDGDVYKRTKYPDQPPDIRAWLDRKSIYISHTEPDPAFAYDKDMSIILKRDFKSIIPFYNFLWAVHDRRTNAQNILNQDVGSGRCSIVKKQKGKEKEC